MDESFERVSLSDYKGKWVVLFFYPFDFTFVCPTEIVSFSEAAEDFRSLNTEVIACSTDSHHTHLAWVQTSRYYILYNMCVFYYLLLSNRLLLF